MPALNSFPEPLHVVDVILIAYRFAEAVLQRPLTLDEQAEISNDCAEYFDRKKQARAVAKILIGPEPIRFSDMQIKVSEYVPDNMIYYLGNQWVRGARS